METRVWLCPSVYTKLDGSYWIPFPVPCFFASFVISIAPLVSFFVAKLIHRLMHFVNLWARFLFYLMTPLTAAYAAKSRPPPLGLKIGMSTYCLFLNIARNPSRVLFARVASQHYTLEILLY
jgi:hypothetical protein